MRGEITRMHFVHVENCQGINFNNYKVLVIKEFKESDTQHVLRWMC